MLFYRFIGLDELIYSFKSRLSIFDGIGNFCFYKIINIMKNFYIEYFDEGFWEVLIDKINNLIKFKGLLGVLEDFVL